jgi:ketosteroid isomerase-like protein
MLRIPGGRSAFPPRPAAQRTRMSEIDVTVFHRFHEAWTRGDLPAALELVDTEVVARPLHGALFSRSDFLGRDGIADWYREMTEPWDRFTAIVEEARDTPEGVKGLLRVTGYRGEESFHARVGVVCQMRAGRILTLTARNVGDVERELRGG